MVSAAGWVDHDTLLIASETALSRYDLITRKAEVIVPLEAENPITRSNDGRADPNGGFWIGTMGKGAELGAGAIYRLYKGELRLLFPGLTIPNAICFAPHGRTAYFTDTATQILNRVALDAAGWPRADPEPFLDLRPQGLHPDGAVTDAAGNIWVALWGAGRVAVFDPAGTQRHSIALPAPHVTCPAFAGTTLYVTSATQGMDANALAQFPDAGKVFAIADAGAGHPEPQVIL
jgi:sugar lactone lactonase YvrE